MEKVKKAKHVQVDRRMFEKVYDLQDEYIDRLGIKMERFLPVLIKRSSETPI